MTHSENTASVFLLYKNLSFLNNLENPYVENTPCNIFVRIFYLSLLWQLFKLLFSDFQYTMVFRGPDGIAKTLFWIEFQ